MNATEFSMTKCQLLKNFFEILSDLETIQLLNSIKNVLIKNYGVNETKYDDRHPNKNNNIRALRYDGNILINRVYH